MTFQELHQQHDTLKNEIVSSLMKLVNFANEIVEKHPELFEELTPLIAKNIIEHNEREYEKALQSAKNNAKRFGLI